MSELAAWLRKQADDDLRAMAARREAELAVIAEYEAAMTVAGIEQDMLGRAGPGVHASVRVLERTVRLLAAAYRHRDGYREEWAP